MAPIRSTIATDATVIVHFSNLLLLFEHGIEGSLRGRGYTCTFDEEQTSCCLQIEYLVQKHF
jgi:hypothetical protein